MLLLKHNQRSCITFSFFRSDQHFPVTQTLDCLDINKADSCTQLAATSSGVVIDETLNTFDCRILHALHLFSIPRIAIGFRQPRVSVILHLPKRFTSSPIIGAWKPTPRQHASPDPASHRRCLYKRFESRKVIVDGVLLKAQASLWGPAEMTYDPSLYTNGQQHSVAGCKSTRNVLISSAQPWIAHTSWPSTSLSLA